MDKQSTTGNDEQHERHVSLSPLKLAKAELSNGSADQCTGSGKSERCARRATVCSTWDVRHTQNMPSHGYYTRDTDCTSNKKRATSKGVLLFHSTRECGKEKGREKCCACKYFIEKSCPTSRVRTSTSSKTIMRSTTIDEQDLERRMAPTSCLLNRPHLSNVFVLVTLWQVVCLVLHSSHFNS